MGLVDAVNYTPRPKPTSETPSGGVQEGSGSGSGSPPNFGVVGGEPDDPEPEPEEPEEDFCEPSEEGLSPLYELMSAVRCLQAVDEELRDVEIDEATRTTLTEQVDFVEELVAAIKSRLG